MSSTIGLISVDSHRYPNLALMKLSAYHKAMGDTVEWVEPLYWDYDRVYQSKIFTFSPDYDRTFPCEVIKGGTGYDIHSHLPDEIDRLQPDYTIYPTIDRHTAYGFLTRGCPNKCPWCIVPEKEGAIHPYMDVEEIAIDGRTNLILMDNNILACDYGLTQIEKIVDNRYRVDFNQAMDARLVTDEVAALLARVRWIKYVRFGCDTPAQISACERAISLMRSHGFSGYFFLYCILTGDFSESFARVNYWHEKRDWKILPFAQPYRDPFPPASVGLRSGSSISPDGPADRRISSPVISANTASGKTSPAPGTSTPQWQKDMAHWVNKRQLYLSCDFESFSPRHGFTCASYFNH